MRKQKGAGRCVCDMNKRRKIILGTFRATILRARCLCIKTNEVVGSTGNLLKDAPLFGFNCCQSSLPFITRQLPRNLYHVLFCNYMSYRSLGGRGDGWGSKMTRNRRIARRFFRSRFADRISGKLIVDAGRNKRNTWTRLYIDHPQATKRNCVRAT